MPRMQIILDGDNCWPDLVAVNDAGKLEWHQDAPVQVALLKNGMTSGAASVSIRVDLPDGRVFAFETSAALFVQAAKAIEARCSEQFKPPEVPPGWGFTKRDGVTTIVRPDDEVIRVNDADIGGLLLCLMLAQKPPKA